MRKQQRNTDSSGTARICAHTIEWRLNREGIRLTDMDIEHICNMLIENYIEGELCTLTPDNQEVRGWWNIAQENFLYPH